MAQEFQVNIQDVFNHVESMKRDLARSLASSEQDRGGNASAMSEAREQLDGLKGVKNVTAEREAVKDQIKGLSRAQTRLGVQQHKMESEIARLEGVLQQAVQTPSVVQNLPQLNTPAPIRSNVSPGYMNGPYANHIRNPINIPQPRPPRAPIGDPVVGDASYSDMQDQPELGAAQINDARMAYLGASDEDAFRIESQLNYLKGQRGVSPQRNALRKQLRAVRGGFKNVYNGGNAPPPAAPTPAMALAPSNHASQQAANGGASPVANPYDSSVSMRDSVIGQFSHDYGIPLGPDGLVEDNYLQSQFGEENAKILSGMGAQVRQALTQGAKIPAMIKAGMGVRQGNRMRAAHIGSIAKIKSNLALQRAGVSDDNREAFDKRVAVFDDASGANQVQMEQALERQAPVNDSILNQNRAYDKAGLAISEAHAKASVGAPFSLASVRGAVQVAGQAGQDNLATIQRVSPNVDIGPIVAKMAEDMTKFRDSLTALSATAKSGEGLGGLEKLITGIEAFKDRINTLEDRLGAGEIQPSALSPVLLGGAHKNYNDALNSTLGNMDMSALSPEMQVRAKQLGLQARGSLNDASGGVGRLGGARQDFLDGKVQSEQDKLDAKAARDKDRAHGADMRSAGIMNKQFDKDRDAAYQNQYGFANKIGGRLGRADAFYNAAEHANLQGNDTLGKDLSVRGDKEMLSLLGRIADILLEIEKLQKTNTNGQNDAAIDMLTGQKDRIEADGNDILNGKPVRQAAGGRAGPGGPGIGGLLGALGGNSGMLGSVGNFLLGQGGKLLGGGLAALGGGASAGMAAAIPAATGVAALGAGATAVTGGAAVAIGATMMAAAASYALSGAGRGDEIAAGRLGEQLNTKGRIIGGITKDGISGNGALKEEFVGLGYKREELYGMLSQMGVVGGTPAQQAGLALTAGSIARQGGIDLNAVGGLGNQLNNASGRQGADETQRLFRQFTATMNSGKDNNNISGSEMAQIVGAAVESSSKTAGGYLSRDATDSLMGQQQAALKAGGIGGIDRLNRANSFFQNNQTTQDVGLFATNNVMVQAEMKRTGKSFGQVVSPNDKAAAANLDKEYSKTQSGGIDTAMSAGLMSRFTAQSILKMSGDGQDTPILRQAVVGSGLMSREQYNDGVLKGNLTDMLKDMAAGKKPIGDKPDVANSSQKDNDGYKSALEQQVRMDEITIQASKLVLTNTSTLIIEAQKGTQVAISGLQSGTDAKQAANAPMMDYLEQQMNAMLDAGISGSFDPMLKQFQKNIDGFGLFVDQLLKGGGKDGNPFTAASYKTGSPGTIVGPNGQAMPMGTFNAMYPGYGGVAGSGVQTRYNNAMYSPPATASAPPATGGGGRVATAPYSSGNTSGAPRSGSLSALRSDGSLDAGFVDNVKGMAGRLGVNYEEILRIMAFETGGQFASNTLNGDVNRDGKITGRESTSGATGLIQFMPKTARGLGTTTNEMAKMSANDQLKYVETYLKRAGVKPGMDSLDMYLSVLFPAAMGKDDGYVLFGDNAALKQFRGHGKGSAYDQNRGLDKNGDFNITRGEIGASLRQSGPYNNLPKTQVIEVKLSGNVSVNGKPSPAAFQIIGNAIAAQIRPSGVSVGRRA